VRETFSLPHLSLMADNILLSFEGLGAGVAGKEPLVTVNVLFVDLKVAAVGKGLHAGLTAIDDVCFHSVVGACEERGRRAVREMFFGEKLTMKISRG